MLTTSYPKPPGAPQTILGHIAALWSVPCAYNPLVIALATELALLQMLIAFAEPDAKFIIETTTEGSWLHHAKQMVRDAEIGGSALTDLSKTALFGFAAGFDIGAFYIWLASVLGDGLWNWTSQIWRMSGCSHPGTYYGWSSTKPVGATDASGGFENGFGWDNANGGSGGIASSFTTYEYGTGPAAYSVTGNILEGDMLIPTGMMTRCRDTTTDEILKTGQFAMHGDTFSPANIFLPYTRSPGGTRVMTFEATTINEAAYANECFPGGGYILLPN